MKTLLIYKKSHRRKYKNKNLMTRIRIDGDVEALGKKSNLSSKCKLISGLKKCPQESPVALRCNTIE
jgi:hypothetical protein